MPVDDSTIEALVQRTKDTLQEGLIVVLHFDDPNSAPNSWDYTYAATSETSTERMLAISNEYAVSEQRGGRPVIFLQIDRNLPGMDVICAKRGVRVFPTLQLWSRGQSEGLKVGELAQRLDALGAVSSSGAARAESGFGRVGTSARLPQPAPSDMFGVGGGGGRLTRGGVSSAMRNAPPQGYQRAAKRLVKRGEGGESEGGDDDLEPPAADGRASLDAVEEQCEGDGIDARVAKLESRVKGARVETALDALFAEPDWDADDLPPPI